MSWLSTRYPSHGCRLPDQRCTPLTERASFLASRKPSLFLERSASCVVRLKIIIQAGFAAELLPSKSLPHKAQAAIAGYLSHRRLPIIFDAEAGIDISTPTELLSCYRRPTPKSILSFVTPNPSSPQPYLLWLRRASYAAPSGRRPPPTSHFVDNAGVASVGRLVLHASVHFRSFKICWLLEQRATCTPCRIASGFSPSTARAWARKASTAQSLMGVTVHPEPNITLNCRSLLLRSWLLGQGFIDDFQTISNLSWFRTVSHLRNPSSILPAGTGESGK